MVPSRLSQGGVPRHKCGTDSSSSRGLLASNSLGMGFIALRAHAIARVFGNANQIPTHVNTTSVQQSVNHNVCEFLMPEVTNKSKMQLCKGMQDGHLSN